MKNKIIELDLVPTCDPNIMLDRKTLKAYVLLMKNKKLQYIPLDKILINPDIIKKEKYTTILGEKFYK
jgi:hypothetical protein